MIAENLGSAEVFEGLAKRIRLIEEAGDSDELENHFEINPFFDPHRYLTGDPDSFTP